MRVGLRSLSKLLTVDVSTSCVPSNLFKTDAFIVRFFFFFGPPEDVSGDDFAPTSPLHRAPQQAVQALPVQLLRQTDICWDQLLLVPAACDLKPLSLMCRGLTRSSGSIHLLLIPCRHQSLNTDTHKENSHAHTHTHTDLLWPPLCRDSPSVLPAGFV